MENVQYSKKALVRMVDSKTSEDRFRLIDIYVDYSTSIEKHKKELIIKLSDENDPFFLYSLHLDEDYYQSWKVTQGLLMDFSLFVKQLNNILKKCDNKENAL